MTIPIPTLVPTSSSKQTESVFTLEAFFPYQVRMFYLQVSQAVRAIYASRYGLSVSEWRTMAVLGSHGAAFEYRQGAGQSGDQGVVDA